MGRRAINWDAGVLYRLSPDASVYVGRQNSIETDIIPAVGPAIFNGSNEPTRTRSAGHAGLHPAGARRSFGLTVAYKSRGLVP